MTELPDRLLRDALRLTAPATPSNVCIDAEALAAWADGTMSRAARAALETHAADCARCQTLMAAMARSAPPPVEPGRWRARLPWLMPLAAATGAIVIVALTVTDRRGPAPQAALPGSAAAVVSRAEERSASPAAAPSEPVPSAAALAASGATGSAIPDSRRDRAAGNTAAVQPHRGPVGGLPESTSELRAKDAAVAAAGVPVSPPAPPVPPFAAPTAAAPKELAAPAPAAAVKEPVSAEAARSDRVSSRAAAPQMMKAAPPAPLLIASPARDSQWRIVAGAVEHTADGGATWQAQALGVDVPVRAGAAPGARVCWLAGSRGVILLTTDGASWRRIGFPESVDLVAVEATDDAHATVTTATGRRFSTDDGGRTWSRR